MSLIQREHDDKQCRVIPWLKYFGVSTVRDASRKLLLASRILERTVKSCQERKQDALSSV